MTWFVRREVVAGAMAATFAVRPALSYATQGAANRSVAVFLYDSRFERSVAMAGSWSRQSAMILDTQACDLGQCWRSRIPDALASGGGIAGITLWSDQYVCEQFGRDHGLKQRPSILLAHGLCHWSLS